MFHKLRNIYIYIYTIYIYIYIYVYLGGGGDVKKLMNVYYYVDFLCKFFLQIKNIPEKISKETKLKIKL